ncbi:AzlC family ABC transporter permease [Paenibacillus sp. TH7-28]
MPNKNELQLAFRAAFPATIPILAGFLFLGIAYGIFMNTSGFGVGYAFLMSLLIFAGSMEFVAVHLLLGVFNPLGAFFLALMVNARHLFYGISMLEKYKGSGLKKIYLIFGMCDETFSINYTAQIPQEVNKGWYMFFVTLLNHIYWVLGATLGGLFGSLIAINMEGLEFVMTALFVVIFIEQWMKETTHHSGLLGLGLSVVGLFIFNGDNFIIPSMMMILCVLTLMRKPLEKKAGETICQ